MSSPSGPTRILFVDDEANILTSLRRLLRRMRSEWDMTFAEGPQAALQELKKQSFDVVVSDMRMPGMSGAELLERTRKSHPDMVRIILSGYATQEALLRAVGPAHNFLSKPCDRETLVENIKRSITVRQRLNAPELRELILKMNSIPSLPSAFLNVTDAVASGESDVEVIGQIVKSDIGMSTKILQFVNSSYFGLDERLSDPLEAVRFLGMGTLKGLVLGSDLFTSAESKAVSDLHTTAYAAVKLVRDLARSVPDVVEEQACLAAMTHEAGRLILAEMYPDSYTDLVAQSEAQGCCLPVMERQAYGLTHSEVGGRLLELWGFPDPVVEAVTFWQEPSAAGSETVSPLSLLHVAKCLLAEAGGGGCQRDLAYIEQVGLRDLMPEWRRSLIPRLRPAA